jgi:glycosyltransferase involved in cell wall biosynthesis
LSIRIVRIIARLNIGGPAIQAITLTQRLSERGYVTTLVRGLEEPDEGSMDDLAASLAVNPMLVPSMRRNPSWRDLPALAALTRIIRRERPQIVHTHAAKGGTLGRLAALIASFGRGRPLIVHTYHGHSLTGYFSPRASAVYRGIERTLGRFTNCLIAVSEEVREELVAMEIAPASKFEVLPLGFDLAPFRAQEAERARAREALRAELGIPANAFLVTLVARLVPIKRVDRFLRIASRLAEVNGVRFLIVGDGELRDELRHSADALQLDNRLTWAGFRRDMPAVCFASDVVVQTSDNEGTPVSLIEAQAAGVPVVSTRVGGTRSVVEEGKTGVLLEPYDVDGFARQLQVLSRAPHTCARMGAAARRHALERFSLERLVNRVDDLYSGLMAERPQWPGGSRQHNRHCAST